MQEIKGGLANSNFCFVTSKDKVLLKICDEKGFEDLQIQAKALKVLHESRAPVPKAYPLSKDSKSFVLESGRKRIVLYTWIEGKAGNFNETNGKMLSEVGKALGKLHSADFKDLSVPEYQLGPKQMKEFLENKVYGTKHEKHPFVSFLKNQMEHLSPKIFSEKLPKGILHGDLSIDNVLFDKDHNLSGVVDFEEICHGPLILDVGMTFGQSGFPEGNVLRKDLLRSFLGAYNEERKLNEEEKECFVSHTCFALLSIAFWRWKQFNVLHFQESLKDKYLELEQRIEMLQLNSQDILLEVKESAK